MIAELKPKGQETIKQGQALFESQIAGKLAAENPDDFLLIDVLTGDYVVSSDEVAGRKKLYSRHPEAVIYLRRVADEAAYTVGGGYQE